jgi:hypothetical protein
MRSRGGHIEMRDTAEAIIEVASSHDPSLARNPLGEHAHWQPTLDEIASRAVRINSPEIEPDVGLEL